MAHAVRNTSQIVPGAIDEAYSGNRSTSMQQKKTGRSRHRSSLPTYIDCRTPILSSSSDYLQLPALWRGTESHSGGGESFSPSELLVFPSSCPEPLGRNFANTDGLLSVNLLFGPIETKEEKHVCGKYTGQLSSHTRLKHSRGYEQLNKGPEVFIKNSLTLPLVLGRFLDLDPFVKRCCVDILDGNDLRCLFSSGGV